MEERSQSHSPPPLGWFGSLLDNKTDAGGLIYMRNRYYDPASGHFTQPDPIGLAGGLNLYGYASGDPINNHDPFGLMDCRKVVCPSIEVVASDANVVKAGNEMFKASQTDGKERSAFLFNGPDGSIVVGAVTVGEPGTTGEIPAPDDAIGMIHTHPDLTVGRPGSPATRGGPPNPYDYAYVRTNHVHGIIEQRDATFYIPWNNLPGVSQQKRSRPPRGGNP